ncbi:MAG: hypothetical protein ACR2JW_13510 [Thermomicrobiales bacterium]
MSNVVRTRDQNLHTESVNADGSMWIDVTDTPRIRTDEEIEALIERLNRNLNERMANRQNITDSVSTVRRMRAVRSRYLRRR